MKEGFDKEIDSLLQRRPRGTAELRSWGDGPGDDLSGAHLDADELGAFAEDALPAAARVAAASHLADCDRCRGVAVGLARVASAGAEVEHQAAAANSTVESARPSAWRALVASLFAPRVLRYATPVLAVSLIAVVSYVALRSNNRGPLQMAREDRNRASTAMREPAAPTIATDSASNANAAGLVEQNSNAAPREAQGAGTASVPTRGHGGAETRPAEDDTDREDAQPSAASPPPPPAAAAEAPAEMSKAAPKTATTEEGEGARGDNKEKSENRDKSARGAEPADSDVASNDASVQRSRSRMNQVQMPDGSVNNQKRAGTDNNASSGYGNVAGAGTAAPPSESERNRAGPRSEAAGRRPAKQEERKADDEKDSQTRTAAGHRFRREGSRWVDVNYKSTMPSTGVRRGTEGFRALVAEVRDVGRVAEAIDGEVIVVVGGHAYHIR